MYGHGLRVSEACGCGYALSERGADGDSIAEAGLSVQPKMPKPETAAAAGSPQ
jgi:hypothetical protein